MIFTTKMDDNDFYYKNPLANLFYDKKHYPMISTIKMHCRYFFHYKNESPNDFYF